MRFKFKAVSLAEALITLVVMSLILAAVMPIMTKKQNVSGDIWRYVASGVGINSNIYYGPGNSQTAIIGKETLPSGSKGSRLVLVTSADATDQGGSTPDTINRSLIDFYQLAGISTDKIGKISFDKNYNLAVGEDCLKDNTIGNENTAVGAFSLSSNKDGSNNSGYGYLALPSNTSGSSNTSIGGSSLYSNQSGNSNTAVGVNASYSNSTGSSNTAIGANSLYSGTTSYNTAIGSYALYSATTGSSNTAVGYQAAYSTLTGAKNAVFGSQALYSNSTGENNTAVGSGALYGNTKGSENAGLGTDALKTNTTGSDNVAAGYDSLFSTTTGSKDVALGSGSLYSNTTGDRNTAIGYQAGKNIANGDENLCIGSGAGPSVGNAGEDGRLYIETNSSYTDSNSLIYGDFRSRSVKVNGSFTITGSGFVNGTTAIVSDLRVKNVVGAYDSGLDKLMQLQVKSFVMKNDKYKKKRIGIIAQDLQKVMPNAVVLGPDGYFYIDTNQILYTMLNSIKQIYRQIAAVTKRIAKLEEDSTLANAQLSKLRNENLAMKNVIVRLEKENKDIKKQIALISKKPK